MVSVTSLKDKQGNCRNFFAIWIWKSKFSGYLSRRELGKVVLEI